ncbi:hypothetical protein CK228_30275 [Mesorhizobium sp. WSM4312]|nr:hypothetical protein CK228_30275 [Mesorhizobium sp. WSM4312]
MAQKWVGCGFSQSPPFVEKSRRTYGSMPAESYEACMGRKAAAEIWRRSAKIMRPRHERPTLN